ncbi:hypothetical protein ACQEVC_10630 [Plantactinospora sp. CA-294935]|uniref:hypothetical protein n=1 Tax=Plantactinospora sp. CA-294935 TaxID=3240012 RepID=UPI003D8A23B4
MRATFDDPNLVSCAGLVPVMRLAQMVGLPAAVADRVHLPGDTGSNPAGKVATIVNVKALTSVPAGQGFFCVGTAGFEPTTP